MKLTFVQLTGFVADCKRLKISDEDVRQLELALLARPDAGATAGRTGGVRKIRFAPPSWHAGKRGAARVLYAHFAVYGHLYFLVAYGKNEQDDLTSEQEKSCRALMKEIAAYLAKSATT